VQPEFIRVCRQFKAEGGSDKRELLRRLAAVPGIYVPAFYDVTYKEDGTIAAFMPNDPAAPATVTKRLVQDIDSIYYPDKVVIPFADVVHDRVMLEVFRGEIAALVPELEKCGVVLALENLPYLEGFPNEDEMSAIAGEFAGAPVMAWFDTGHHRVRECCGWLSESAEGKPPPKDIVRGMHLNDVTDINDDHFAPGDGKVDFAALKVMMHSVRHVVFEPHSHVSQESLAKGLELIKSLAAKA